MLVPPHLPVRYVLAGQDDVQHDAAWPGLPWKPALGVQREMDVEPAGDCVLLGHGGQA